MIAVQISDRTAEAFMRIRAFITLVLSLVLITTSCGSTGGSLFSYRDHDASFTAVFPSHFTPDEIVCQGTRCGSRVTLTVISPARSSGITAEYDGASLILRAGETAIPLSNEVSANLTDLFDLLYFIPTEQLRAHKSDDGGSTILVCPSGQVELGEENLPISVTAANGKSAVIKNYAVSDQNNSLPKDNLE